MTTRLLSWAALICLLASCSLPVPRHLAPRAGGTTLRIVSWNVNWGVSAPDVVAQFLRQSGADVVCLQETNSTWESELTSRLADAYQHRVFLESEGRMGGGLAFLSKVRGREVAHVPSSTGWFDGWIMAFPDAGGETQVLNVHLRPPVSDSGSAVSGYVTTRDDREDEIDRFAASADRLLPLIVCGDFNESPTGRAVCSLERRGMVNVLPLFDDHSPTWTWRTSVVTLRRRMDHVLVQSTRWNWLNAQVIPVRASDHYPVVVDLTRK